MPSSLTYPGVYVEEIPSGVRTITGVATSVTAFIGRARKGPIDEAVDITSFADFERNFGGLWLDSTMSFAVRDFFLNGGARAVIVRLFHSVATEAVASIAAAARPEANGKDAKTKAQEKLKAIKDDASKSAAEKNAADKAIVPISALADAADKAAVGDAADKALATAKQLPGDPRSIDVIDFGGVSTSLKFRAASPGKWAGHLRVQVEKASGPGLDGVASVLGVTKDDLFKLTVTDLGPGGGSETHLNVALKKNCVRRVDKVLVATSGLIRWNGDNLDTTAVALPDLTEPNRPNPDVDDKKVKGDELANAYAALAFARKADPDPTSDAIKEAKKALDAAIDAALASVDDGGPLGFNDFVPPGGEAAKKGLHSLEQLYTRDGIFNLLCIAPYTATQDVQPNLIAVAGAYCEKRRAMLLVDAPTSWGSVNGAAKGFSGDPDEVGYRGRNAALFFPRLLMPNPLRDNQIEPFAACGAIAGIFARTDTQRGVWKAPAGMDASVIGASSFTLPVTDDENGLLNPLGINCLRTFPTFGRVVWGARTLRGADAFADEYKYTSVRRTALFIEESLYRALKWVVFEPNDEPLWAQIRLNVGAFMNNLFRQGAFQGQTKNEAYFVRCSSETTTQNDINLGIVNINVGFAPLKPAEFVVIRLQQMAGEIET